MFKHGSVSTQIDKKPFFFTLTAAVGSAIAAVLLFMLGRGEVLAVFAGILMAIVGAVSAFILFVMLTDYAYIENGVLNTRYLFKKTRIPLDEIECVRVKDNVYRVFGRRGDELASINGLLTGIDALIEALDAYGVRFE